MQEKDLPAHRSKSMKTLFFNILLVTDKIKRRYVILKVYKVWRNYSPYQDSKPRLDCYLKSTQIQPFIVKNLKLPR